MPIRFVDEGGNEGWIDDDLTVRYVGGFDVHRAVDDIVDEDMSVEEATNELIVQLPRGRPITSVEREAAYRDHGDDASDSPDVGTE